jgi:hypothetical protein
MWDVLTMLRFAIRGKDAGARGVRLGVHARNNNRDSAPPLVRLKAVYGSADHGVPVVTVTMADED